MSLIVIQSISNRLVRDQGADLYDEGATGAGFWLIQESRDGKSWVVLARFVSEEQARYFAEMYDAELILEGE